MDGSHKTSVKWENLVSRVNTQCLGLNKIDRAHKQESMAIHKKKKKNITQIISEEAQN